MSYDDAIRLFEDNVQRIGVPTNEPYGWNLNSGLSALAAALQSDLNQIKSLLSRISSSPQHPRVP